MDEGWILNKNNEFDFIAKLFALIGSQVSVAYHKTVIDGFVYLNHNLCMTP